MKISIITPTFNSAANISRCADSIVSQSYQNFEHLIIDNVSSDATLDLVAETYARAGKTERLKIISEPDNGITEAFNKGIARANGEIVTILNSDDYYLDNKVFDDVVKTLNEACYLFLHSHIVYLDPKYGAAIKYPKHTIESLAPYHHMSMFLKKEVYEDYGPFDTEFRWAMDFEHWCRLHKQNPQINEQACYFNDRPLVAMDGGGDSAVNELKVAKYEKKALELHGFIQFRYRKAIFMRSLRIRIKRIVDRPGFRWVVVWWRSKKWRE